MMVAQYGDNAIIPYEAEGRWKRQFKEYTSQIRYKIFKQLNINVKKAHMYIYFNPYHGEFVSGNMNI